MTTFRRRCLASVAVMVLLLAACGSDGAGPNEANDGAADSSVDASPPSEPTTEPEPTATPTPMSEAAPGMAMQGKMTAQCAFGNADPNPQSGRIRASQDCALSSDAGLPIDGEQGLFIEFLNSGPPSTFGDPIIGFAETAHVYGGYVIGAGDGRFVSSALGVGDYAGKVVHIVGHSPGDGNVTFDWYIGDGPQPFGATGDFDETVEVRIECSPVDVPADADDDVTSVETCTYTSDDSRLSLAPTTDLIQAVAVEGIGTDTGSVWYYTAQTDSGVVRGGLVDENGVRRWAGVVDKLDEIDGPVHEVGWAQTDEDGVTSGVILVSFG